MGILDDPNEGYSPNYTGPHGFSKCYPHIRIYAFMNSMPQKKDFDYVCMNKLNTITTICFMKL